jgi:hypothetical protein
MGPSVQQRASINIRHKWRFKQRASHLPRRERLLAAPLQYNRACGSPRPDSRTVALARAPTPFGSVKARAAGTKLFTNRSSHRAPRIAKLSLRAGFQFPTVDHCKHRSQRSVQTPTSRNAPARHDSAVVGYHIAIASQLGARFRWELLFPLV